METNTKPNAVIRVEILHYYPGCGLVSVRPVTNWHTMTPNLLVPVENVELAEPVEGLVIEDDDAA